MEWKVSTPWRVWRALLMDALGIRETRRDQGVPEDALHCLEGVCYISFSFFLFFFSVMVRKDLMFLCADISLFIMS